MEVLQEHLYNPILHRKGEKKSTKLLDQSFEAKGKVKAKGWQHGGSRVDMPYSWLWG